MTNNVTLYLRKCNNQMCKQHYLKEWDCLVKLYNVMIVCGSMDEYSYVREYIPIPFDLYESFILYFVTVATAGNLLQIC